jgi:hypothetical protein
VNDPEFALYKRVAWEQRMKKTELITGLMLAKAAIACHKHGSGSLGRGGSSAVPGALERIIKIVGMPALRANVKEFFEIIDVCWGLRAIEYNTIAPQVRGNWLIVLGTILSDHTNFWDGKELFVDADMKRKFKSFPLHDTNVIHLCSSGNMAIPMLYNLVRQHMDKGRRVNRLVPRKESVNKRMEEEGEG